ncbi:hypothetical protein KP509_02G030700 [Ceratopteris richardii]|uniref:E3 ubiquitin-protein ligase RNF170 n=1 Tax=Ceratopteris richardii TaxID=49495 RepID=A0A8T2V4D1_CERRI|nr:hypothetical protein KP509_02G030700 [Ceratopteris richardii]
MSILEGVGDELIYTVLFAAPVILIFRSSLGSLAVRVYNAGFVTLGNWINRVWNVMWNRELSRASGVPDGNGVFRASMVVPSQNDICSICHDPYTFPCQSNCSHWFCGDCILRVWQHASALQPCRCPICRRSINLLIPSQFEQDEGPEAQRVLREIANYNRLHGDGPRSLVQRVRDMPLLLRRLARDLMDPQRALPLVHRTRIIIYLMLAVFYVLSPLDILPEGLFGIIGLFDDFLLMAVVLFHLASIYRASLVQQFGFRVPDLLKVILNNRPEHSTEIIFSSSEYNF